MIKVENGKNKLQRETCRINKRLFSGKGRMNVEIWKNCEK